MAFGFIQGSLQHITVEKLIELSMCDLKILNSIHFLDPSKHIPLRESSYYTFAYLDMNGEISNFLVKRTIVAEIFPTAGHESS